MHLLRVLYCVFWFNAVIQHAGAWNISPGRQVILNRGLQIQCLGFVSSTPAAPADYSLWASAHFTTFNSWNDQNAEKILVWSMPWARWIKTDGSNPLTTNEKNQHLNELVSLQYGDELNQDGTGHIDSDTLATMAGYYESWHDQFGSNFLAYSNFGANNATKTMTPAGLAEYLRETRADMLMFDAYPLQYVTMNTWYLEMQKYRVAGLAGLDGTGQTPIPYAQYLDLYRTSFGASLPSESFVRLQQFASWAFGYTFVNAFVYNKPNNVTVFPALFSSEGDSQPTAVFNQVAEANRQSLNLGPALIRLVSTDVRMMVGTGHTQPAGILTWNSSAGGNNYIASITAVTSPGGGPSPARADIIIGYFMPLLPSNPDFPFADGLHFMLVNGATTGSAAGSAQWYHLVFNFSPGGPNGLQRLNRSTGLVEDMPLTLVAGNQYSLDINLEGGTGDLFRFATNASSGFSTMAMPILDSQQNLILTGTNFGGAMGGSYHILSSPDLALPLNAWVTKASGNFDAWGAFSNAVPMNPVESSRFFILRTP